MSPRAEIINTSPSPFWSREVGFATISRFLTLGVKTRLDTSDPVYIRLDKSGICKQRCFGLEVWFRLIRTEKDSKVVGKICDQGHGPSACMAYSLPSGLDARLCEADCRCRV